ncbi:MAG: hypothetical protein R2748_01205 [Bryobacterales bacterium]
METRALSAEGLNAAGEATAELLARSSTLAVLLPNAEFHKGAARLAPARLLIDRQRCIVDCERLPAPRIGPALAYKWRWP